MIRCDCKISFLILGGQGILIIHLFYCTVGEVVFSWTEKERFTSDGLTKKYNEGYRQGIGRTQFCEQEAVLLAVTRH